MAFKMKGSSLYGKLKLNRDMDKSSKDDGRAQSSAFQKKVDLRKKEGLGPRAAKGKDDQSKELAKSRYEMGKYKNDPTKKNRPEPTYPGTDEYRKEKDIPKSEFKARGIKK